MGKSKYNEDFYYDEYDNDHEDYENFREETKQRKKQRRIDRALKTKNIDELLEYYDDEEDYRR